MPDRHRLVLRCPSGNPAETTIHLDGEQLTFVSRVELVLDVNGESTVTLTVPGALLDINADVAAFVEAHPQQQPASGNTTTCAVLHLDEHGNSIPCPDEQRLVDAVEAQLLRRATRRTGPFKRYRR